MKALIWVPATGSLIFSLSPTAALSQEVRDYGTTTRGLLRDNSETAAAAQALEAAGVECDIVDSRRRGTDANGVTQFEVACEGAPGYIVFDTPRRPAVSCMALHRGSSVRGARGTRCDLRGNRNLDRYFASMAASAGIDCRVDEGRLVGLTPLGGEIYEIGCANAAGAWITRGRTGTSTTHCWRIVAEGNACNFTTSSELRSSLEQKLSGTPIERCEIAAQRYMGLGYNAEYFEVRCNDGGTYVIRFSTSDGSFIGLTECSEARLIGGGCEL